MNRLLVAIDDNWWFTPAGHMTKLSDLFFFYRIEETKELAQRENANGEKVAVELEPLSPEVPV